MFVVVVLVIYIMCRQAISHEEKEIYTMVRMTCTKINQYLRYIYVYYFSMSHMYSDGGHTGDSNLPDSSSQVSGPVYAEITDEDPTYASVEVATGKYTYNITTNSSYNTVMLHNLNPNIY